MRMVLQITVLHFGIGTINKTEHNRHFLILKLLQFLVTLHTYTHSYNIGDKTGHTNTNGWTLWYDMPLYRCLL